MPFFPLFWLVEARVDNLYTFGPRREKGYSLPPALICNALTQGRKFTAKSERDVICGKTLLFSMKSSQAPG